MVWTEITLKGGKKIILLSANLDGWLAFWFHQNVSVNRLLLHHTSCFVAQFWKGIYNRPYCRLEIYFLSSPLAVRVGSRSKEEKWSCNIWWKMQKSRLTHCFGLILFLNISVSVDPPVATKYILYCTYIFFRWFVSLVTPICFKERIPKCEWEY